MGCKTQPTNKTYCLNGWAYLLAAVDLAVDALEDKVKPLSVPGAVVLDRHLTIVWPLLLGPVYADHPFSL